MRCSVPYCNNDTVTAKKGKGLFFNSFPKDELQRGSWLDALNMPADTISGVVCSDHFSKDDVYQTRTGVWKVKTGSVPISYQDSADDLDAPAAEKICRICLGMNRKLYHIRECKMEMAFQYITGLPPSEEDKLPQKLCWECYYRLKSLIRFKAKSVRSQEYLMRIITTNHYISIRDIKSLDNSTLDLKSTLSCRYLDNSHVIEVNFDDEVKSEEKVESDGEEGLSPNDYPEPLDGTDHPDEVKVELGAVPSEMEVKNEIYLNEYTDNFDSEDEQTLSEVYKKDNSKSKNKKVVKLKKARVKKRDGKKKEKETVDRKRERAKTDDENNPETTMDKYKTSNVKRRKNDGLDESLFTITTLTYEEQIAEVSRRAESAMYVSAPYKCTACYRGFLNVDRYYSHRIRHTDAAGAYECFICKTRLKSGRALRKHLTAQHTEKFSCKGCTFSTRNRGVAREHEKWHAGTKYQCPHCPSEFDKVTTYMGHIRIKHVSDCVCELCGYTFISQKGIDVHKKKKHRIIDKNMELAGPYCEVCGVKFLSEEAHARHLKLSSRHSSDSDPNRLRNDSQSKGSVGATSSRRAPDARDARAGAEQAAPVTCEQCGVELRDLRLYAQHFRRAHPDKNRTKYPAMKTPAMCELCGRIFQSMALLKDHMWVHTGEKRFKCDRCDKSFTQKTNLVFHMRVHSASRPSYECPLCGKHFAFYNNRRRHMFIHTGLKPFKCSTCGKCFTTAGEQRAHLEHVHLKKPWPKRARPPPDQPPYH